MWNDRAHTARSFSLRWRSIKPDPKDYPGGTVFETRAIINNTNPNAQLLNPQANRPGQSKIVLYDNYQYQEPCIQKLKWGTG